MRALFSAVSGVRSHQVRMDVIGNNIANVNTTGFKGSRVTFSDVLSQTMSQGSARTTPQQVGLGVSVASTDLDMGAGSLQLTGRSLDLAIQGNGMFVLKTTTGQMTYTRAGNFDWDSEGYLVNPGTGRRVQGWSADPLTGEIENTGMGTLGDIQVPRGAVVPAEPTTNVEFTGNLDPGAAEGTVVETAVNAYDSLGHMHTMPVQFTKTANANEWSWSYLKPGDAAYTAGGTFTFSTEGRLDPPAAPGSVTLAIPGADDLTFNLDFNKMVQAYTGVPGSQVSSASDGTYMGVLEMINVDQAGQVIGVFSNGERSLLGQIATANFANPGGLLKDGDTSFVESSSSGRPDIGLPDTGGRGRLLPGNLEMSNVDLSTEFTNMILTQRGFQANTRVITTSDSMLEEVVNLRR